MAARSRSNGTNFDWLRKSCDISTCDLSPDGNPEKYGRPMKSAITGFNTRNKLLTLKILKQGYRYHKLPETFSKFYRRYYNLISKFQVGHKSLLRHGLSEPEFYGDLVYKLMKIVCSNNFSAQFI